MRQQVVAESHLAFVRSLVEVEQQVVELRLVVELVQVLAVDLVQHFLLSFVVLVLLHVQEDSHYARTASRGWIASRFTWTELKR